MTRPAGLLRAGYPYVRTYGMRRITNFPSDLAIGSSGSLYILCRGVDAMVRILSNDDEDMGYIGSFGKGEGQLTGPVSIQMDDNENIYISDEVLHRITILDTDGSYVNSWGEHGSDKGQFDRPSGIALDSNGHVYVSDAFNHRVQQYTNDGKFINSWGVEGSGEGQFNYPWGVAVDDEGDVYVSDWRNDRIQKFTNDGEFIFEFGGSGKGPGELHRPAGVEVDVDGDIYVADAGNDRIQLFNAEGRYVERFFGDATLSKQGLDYLVNNAVPLRLRDMADLEPQKRFKSPKAVRFDDKTGCMYVADTESYRVQSYRKDVVRLNEDQIAPSMRNPTLATT